MSQVNLDQMPLDPLLRAKTVDYLQRLGRGMLVDMYELETELAHMQTLADVLKVTRVFSTAPLMQQYMIDTQEDGQRMMLPCLLMTLHYYTEEAGDSNTVTQLGFVFTLRHPMLQEPSTFAKVTLSRTESALQCAGGALSEANEAACTVNNSFFEPSNLQRMGPIYGFIGEMIYRTAAAFNYDIGSVSALMQSELMEKTGFVDVLDLMVNPNLHPPLEKMFKLADSTLEVNENDSLYAAYKRLRQRLGPMICGYDIVALFNGRRKRLSLPMLATASGSHLDVCNLYISLAEHEDSIIDTLLVRADSKANRLVIEHALFHLRGGETDNIASDIREEGEQRMSQLAEAYPEMVMAEQRQRLIRALKGFAPYCTKRPEVEQMRRTLLRRLITPAEVI